MSAPWKGKKNVNLMSRKALVQHFNQMEIPEMNASDYDTIDLREMLIGFAGDIYKMEKRGGKVSLKSGGKIMQGYKADGKV